MEQTDKTKNESPENKLVIGAFIIGGVDVAKKGAELTNINKTLFELDHISERMQKVSDNKWMLEREWKIVCSDISDTTKKCLPMDICWSKSKIIEEIRRQKVKLAHKTIQSGAILSAILIMYQAKTMRDIWSAIKNAENLADESKAEVEILEAKMNVLSKLSEDLALLVSNYESNNEMEEKEAKKLFRTITNKKNGLQMQYVNINNMISDFKVNVNGRKHSVMSIQKEATSSGIACTFNAVTNAIYYFQFQNVIDLKMKALQIGIAGLFSLMALANVEMYRITEEILQNICGTLQQINEISKQLVAIENLLLETANWLEENEEEL